MPTANEWTDPGADAVLTRESGAAFDFLAARESIAKADRIRMDTDAGIVELPAWARTYALEA